MKPRVDRSLAALVPPLTAAEHAELEASIVRDGCRDPVVVWKGRGAFLDGHHRFEVCERLGVPYGTVEVELPDEAAAGEWVVRNALGRRNLTPYQRAELALMLEPEVAARAKERQRAAGGPLPQNSAEPPIETRQELARLAGVSHDTIARAKAVRERADEKTRAMLRAGELSLNQAYHRVRRAEVEASREARREENRRLVEAAPSLEAALADARFATIVADPPWTYGDDWDPFGRGRPEYATMGVDELCALPVAAKADDDAHLYLWTASRLISSAERVAQAWGFRPAALLTWCKPGLGMGRYFRSTTEHVVFAVRGNLPLKRKDAGTWFEAPRTRHSEKPACFHDLVESCSPGPYLELFARKARPGWTAWGAEAPAA